MVIAVLKRKIRATFCNCYECNKKLDGQLVNIIEMYSTNIFLCDDCMEGLSKICAIKDNKTHQYISANKRIY